MIRKSWGFALALALVLTLVTMPSLRAAIATPFADVFAGGVSGSMTRNQIPKVSGPSQIADSNLNDDGTTVTLAATKTLAVTTADKLTIGGVIAPQEIEVTFWARANGEAVDQAFFIANQAYQVTKVRQVHSTAGNDAGAVNVQLVKDTGTNAPGAGTDLLTNNTNAGFDLKGTANTVQAGTLTATTASLQLAAGDRLSLDFAGTTTSLVGVVVTVTLKRI